jgi:hypothetical protein
MSGAIGLPPIPIYLALAAKEQQYVANYAKQDPQAQAAVTYFQNHASKLTTPNALLKDYRSLQVVLGAFNMSGDINKTAILKQLMTQNPADPKSLAQKLLNPNYLRFAQFMSTWNPPPLSNPANVSAIANQFMTASFEQAEGEQAPGLQQALYFKRTIGSVTSIEQIMADPTLLQVAETATNQPDQFGLLDFSQQRNILSKSISMQQFSTPAGINKFIERYLALNELNSNSSSASDSGSGNMTVADLFGSETGSIVSLFG